MRNRIIFIILVIIFLCFGTILPLLRGGFFQVHDDTAVVRVYEMSQSLSDGAFPVRWVSYLGYGYGYPIYNFYSPLPYYVGSILNLGGFNLLSATKLMIAIGTLASAVTMFFFSKKYFGILGGVLSAVCYAYFPYHAVDIYVRGAIGEYYAYAFLPLVFLGLFSLTEFKKVKEIILSNETLPALSIGIFTVAVSHNLTIFMTLILFLPAILFGFFISKNKKAFITLSVIFTAIGLLLASFYIVPAFLEMGYTNVSSQVGGGADFRDHFVCLSQVWQSQWGFGGSIPGCIDGLSFAFGKFNLLLLAFTGAVAIYQLLKRKAVGNEKFVIISLLLFFISVFLMTSSSKFIWENISYMAYIQYPWRFINFSALFLSFAVGYTAYFLKKSSNFLAIPLVCIILLVLIFASLKHFQPQTYNDHNSAYFENKDYIRYNVSKISDEYLPKDFAKPITLSDIPNQLFEVKKGNGFISTIVDNSAVKKASYAFEDAGIVHINTAYFPAWKVYVDGVSVPIAQNNNGMDIMVKKGSGEITVSFEQTLAEVFANLLTIASFLTVLAVIIFSKTYAKKTS